MKTAFLSFFLKRLWIKRNRGLQAAGLACACFLALNLVFYLMTIRPLVSDLSMRESRNAELRKQHAEGVLFQKQRKTFGSLSAGVPTQKDMPLLVKDLGQAARGLHLSVGSVNYEIPRSTGEITMLAFTFPVTGKYADLKRFAYEVETSRRPVGIETFELKSGRGGVEMNLKLITYVRGSK